MAELTAILWLLIMSAQEKPLTAAERKGGENTASKAIECNDDFGQLAAA